MKVTVTLDVRAPRDEVFAFFSDLEQARTHISGIKRLEVLSGPAQMAAGTSWRETREMFGTESTEVMTVTELVPFEYYVVSAASHGSEYVSRYEFTPNETGTTVVMAFTGTPVNWKAKLMAPLGWLMKGSVRKMLEQDLGELKVALER